MNNRTGVHGNTTILLHKIQLLILETANHKNLFSREPITLNFRNKSKAFRAKPKIHRQPF